MSKIKTEYEKLLEIPFNTQRQVEFLNALIECDTVKEAGEQIGISERGAYKMLRRIRERQNAIGEGSHYIGNTNLRDTGLFVDKTSTLYKTQAEDGAILQWVKTDHKLENQYEAYLELLRDETSHLHQHYKKIKAPRKTNKDLITNYMTTDLHFGALMWHEETGHDYDLNIAQETLLESFSDLLSRMPNTETCLITDLGDMVEADDFTNMTKRSGNILDVDGRYPKIFRMVRDTFVEMVQMALQKHKKVIVLFIKGNHDDMTSFQVQEYLAGYFRKEKRVHIDISLKPRKYYIHGKTILGFTHGHEMKPHSCGEVMAHECSEYIDKNQRRYFHFGHVHKDSSGENVICSWETHKNLPPSNAWAMGNGYVSQLGTMKATTYCKDGGKKDVSIFPVTLEKYDDKEAYDSKII